MFKLTKIIILSYLLFLTSLLAQENQSTIANNKQLYSSLRMNHTLFNIDNIDSSPLLFNDRLRRYNSRKHVYGSLFVAPEKFNITPINRSLYLDLKDSKVLKIPTPLNPFHVNGPLDVYPEDLRALSDRLFNLYHICDICKKQPEQLGYIRQHCNNCLIKPTYTIGHVMKLLKIHMQNIQHGVCCVLTDTSSIKIQHNKTKVIRFPYRNIYKESNVTKFDQMSVVKNAGSGFLIRDKWVLTASHNLGNKDVSQLHFVFGYYPSRDEEQYDIIRGKRLIKKGLTKNGNNKYGSDKDWAIIELERKPKKSHLMPLGKLRRPIYKQGVFMLGHPRGLPLMSTINGYVYGEVRRKILCNLDAFAGNSGSPVYSTDNLNIIGMLVAGNEDSNTVNNNLYLSTSPPTIDHSREKFIELDEVIEFLKKN